MTTHKNYWLMKSEPGTYSIDDLKRDRTTSWEGVRNYQARNFMRDKMRVGDLVLFYHASANPAGVAGLAKVCKKAYPDDAAWNKKSKYYDPKSTPEKPLWWMVDVQFTKKFSDVIPLSELKSNPKLAEMLVTKRGMRLSVQPVERRHFDLVVAMVEK